jgi:hypothetical protein
MNRSDEFRRNRSFLQDLVLFLMESKKWWLIPIAVVLLVMGLLVALGATSAAPFIYTLF